MGNFFNCISDRSTSYHFLQPAIARVRCAPLPAATATLLVRLETTKSLYKIPFQGMLWLTSQSTTTTHLPGYLSAF